MFVASTAFGLAGCTGTPPSETTTTTSTTSSTTTSTTTTSTTTTSTTTTTLALRAPVPANDEYTVAIGGSVSGNVLTNDDLGNPAGSVSLVVWQGGSAAPGVPGNHPVGVITMQADGSFVFHNTGIPAGSWIFFNYKLTNSVGTTTGLMKISGA